MSDFWDKLTEGYNGKVAASMDHYLGGRPFDGDHYNSVRLLTDSGREKASLKLPVKAGTRVSFVDNLGSLLTYDNPPAKGTKGTVVTVRTADGDTTYFDENVFVQWDDDVFRPIHRQHLRRASGNKKRASSVRLVTSNLGNLSDFFKEACNASGYLIHKATEDFWSLEKCQEGYVLSRLFDDNGSPLKV